MRSSRSARRRHAARTGRAEGRCRTAIRPPASRGCSPRRSLRLDFDAWAQHPYPPRPGIAPARSVRWPRVALGNLELFGGSLDDWFGRDGTPIWITEYAHETVPDPVGISFETQARFAEEALTLAAGNPRVRVLVWFTLVDRPGDRWQSGLVAEDGSTKPAYERFAAVASTLDPRNPVLPSGADVARVPALELAYYVPAGAPVAVETDTGETFSVPLGEDGWLDVPVADERLGGLAPRHR